MLAICFFSFSAHVAVFFVVVVVVVTVFLSSFCL